MLSRDGTCAFDSPEVACFLLGHAGVMSINLPQLLAGLLLLWFPRQWMRLGLAVRRRRRSGVPKRRDEEPWLRRDPSDQSLSLRREVRKLRNYFDLLRAAVGGVAIMGLGDIDPAIQVGEAGEPLSPWVLLALNVGILLVGLLIQTIRTERRHLTFFASVFFLAGLSITLCSPWGALFAFVLVWGLNPMVGSAVGFLTLYGVLQGVFGALFLGRHEILPVVAGVICWLPMLLSLMFRRPLVVFTRKSTHPVGGRT